jgi:hypothetical protein
MMGCDAHVNGRIRREIQLPGKADESSFKFPEIGGLKQADPHEHPVGGAKHQVGLIAFVKASAELDAPRNGSSVLGGEGKLVKLLQAEGFKAGGSGDEKLPGAPDDLALDPLGRCGFARFHRLALI